MVSNSKILTVSYGTFSCTLEGFDESFDTMKAIAEYFRDLAADDRYFGAEPPTPDAEMLARIAEKEIARRVEAHEEEGKIHLRANATPALPATPEVEREPEAESLVAEPQAEEEAIEEPAEVEAETPDAPVAEETAEELSADEAVTASIESAMADADEASEEVDTPVIEEVDTPAVEDILEDAETEEEAPAEEAVSEEEDDDSVAARLRRIRSVVAKGTNDFESEGFSEDEHAQDFLNDTVSDLDAALMADTPEAEEMPERVISEVLEDGAHEDALASVTEELSATQEDEFEEDTSDFEDLAQDTLSQLLADAVPEDEEEDSFDTAAFDGDADEDANFEDEDTSETPLRARVIKMKRSDFEAAVADGAFEESFDMLEEDAEDDEPAEAILSPEDEADLQSELDAVTAELEAEMDMSEETDTDLEASDEDEASELQEDAEQDEETDPPVKSQMLDKSDRPVSRLFDEAQSQLNTPEATRRRNAIQHLRAAVEANTAETDAGSELTPVKDEGAYRDDIADVMRTNDAEDTVEAQMTDGATPTRARSRRPVESRPAPLKLVAEQRVDVPSDPVRPRRVSTAHLNDTTELPSDAGSFSDFAEDNGATDLPALLEAAAAFVSDVEGRPQFSRRTLMGKIDEFSADAFSREDRLKSFGQLLRHGKLQKLKGGQFTVTDETDYRTQARNVG